jgi:hypothetical protein
MIFGFGLALLVALGASACGGDGGKDVAKSAPPTTTAPQTSAAATPSAAAADKVVYHDALVGNDVTVKNFPTITGAVPAKLTCKDLLRGGKILGNTYPNGEDFYLQLCKQVPRK